MMATFFFGDYSVRASHRRRCKFGYGYSLYILGSDIRDVIFISLDFPLRRVDKIQGGTIKHTKTVSTEHFPLNINVAFQLSQGFEPPMLHRKSSYFTTMTCPWEHDSCFFMLFKMAIGQWELGLTSFSLNQCAIGIRLYVKHPIIMTYSLIGIKVYT